MIFTQKKEISVQRDSSHRRMLIGDFHPAIEAIHPALKYLGINPFSLFCKKKKCSYPSFGKNRRWAIKSEDSLI